MTASNRRLKVGQNRRTINVTEVGTHQVRRNLSERSNAFGLKRVDAWR
jgi:hypothetical protein